MEKILVKILLNRCHQLNLFKDQIIRSMRNDIFIMIFLYNILIKQYYY